MENQQVIAAGICMGESAGYWCPQGGEGADAGAARM